MSPLSSADAWLADGQSGIFPSNVRSPRHPSSSTSPLLRSTSNASRLLRAILSLRQEPQATPPPCTRSASPPCVLVSAPLPTSNAPRSPSTLPHLNSNSPTRPTSPSRKSSRSNLLFRKRRLAVLLRSRRRRRASFPDEWARHLLEELGLGQERRWRAKRCTRSSEDDVVCGTDASHRDGQFVQLL